MVTRSNFYHILETACTFDAIGDEYMSYPTFETEEELSLFEHFMDMLGNTQYLEKIGFKNFIHSHEKEITHV